MDEPKIKPQFKLVATYYVGECAGNAELSVVKAGYSKAYARGNAYKIVARKDVREYIEYLKEQMASNPSNPALHIATISEVQSYWTETMHDESLKRSDRTRASELLAKAQGQFSVDGW